MRGLTRRDRGLALPVAVRSERERLRGTPCTERELEAIAAYGRLGDQAAVAEALGVTKQHVKNLLTHVYMRLEAVSAIDALHKLGWLRVPEASEVALEALAAETAAIQARVRWIQREAARLLDQMTAPGSSSPAGYPRVPAEAAATPASSLREVV